MVASENKQVLLVFAAAGEEEVEEGEVAFCAEATLPMTTAYFSKWTSISPGFAALPHDVMIVLRP